MKNKFNETGTDFGKTQGKPKLKKNEFIKNPTFRKEQIDELKKRWTDPEGTLKLNKWLIELVNTKEEYDLLQKEIVEQEFLISLSSNSLKGGPD